MTLAERLAWHSEASCRGFNARLFFAEHNEPAAARDERETQAKAVCRTCTVQGECLDAALSAPEPWGVWGGMGEAERSALRADARSRATAISGGAS
jgi:WhiB family redox-sensing transcriptional regulator